jgi:hypothetical protein
MLKNKNGNATQRIDQHEKLCRIMQKQTFQQMTEMKERICRLEKVLVCGLFAIFLALLSNNF